MVVYLRPLSVERFQITSAASISIAPEDPLLRNYGLPDIQYIRQILVGMKQQK